MDLTVQQPLHICVLILLQNVMLPLSNPRESKEHLRSVKMDKILTGKYTAIPCFAGIMGLVFYLTFGVIIGSFLSDLLDSCISALSTLVDHFSFSGM